MESVRTPVGRPRVAAVLGESLCEAVHATGHGAVDTRSDVRWCIVTLAIAGPANLAQLAPLLHSDPAGPPPLLSGPTGSVVTQLVAGLVARGHEVLLVTVSDAVDDEVVLEGPRLRVCVGRRRARHRARDAFRAERAYVTARLLRERPELVHAQWTYEYALGALRTGLPTLVSIRDWAPRDVLLYRHPYFFVRFLMNARTLHRGDHFTVSSPSMQRRAERLLRHPVTLIPNAVRDDQFLSTQRQLRHEPSVLLAVNNGFSARKNVRRLLEAFALVRARQPHARLRLVGQRYEQGGPAHRWALEHQLQQGVDFMGPMQHAGVTACMREADLFVHPSLEESFGNVLVEAMAQRLPIVAGANSGAVPWVTGDGAAGLLTDVTSASAMAEATLALLGDEVAWGSASQAGYAYAWKNFRLSQVLQAYEREYDRVLEAAGERPHA